MDFVSARLNMVESQVRTNDVTDLDLVDAMRAIHREAFCPADKAHLAYAEKSVEYAPGRFLLAPRDVAKLVFSARPRAGERALAIAGPYAAAMLARAGLTVTALEPADSDATVRAMLSGERVAVVGGDLLAPPAGPFDVVVVEGAVARTPGSWLESLAPGGRLAVIERGEQLGKAQLYSKGEDGGVARRTTFDAIAPYIAGFEPARAFQF
jgi:protein-L-isoaspartate(D-aspartate) O-methyltransferase